LHGWASANPAEALAWLDEHAAAASPPEWYGPARRELILGWMKTSFEGPAQWFRDHPDDPAFDESLAAFAAEAAAHDPRSAFEWASAAEGTWRAFAMEQASREWLSRDRDAAEEALLRSGYMIEGIDRLATPPEGRDITRDAGSIGIADGIHIGG
jgi:hypothetical protein